MKNLTIRHQEFKSHCLHTCMLATDLGSLGGFLLSMEVGMDNEEILKSKRTWAKRKKEILDSINADRDICPSELLRGFAYAFGASALLIGVLVWFLFFGGCNHAYADVINLKKIAQIESSGCKNKNGDSGASVGCYQVKDALIEWNQFHPKQQYSKRQMLNDELCLKVADWYFHKRIPQMLKAFKKPVTVKNILVAYNAGISYVVKNKALPKTTVAYLRKYGVQS